MAMDPPPHLVVISSKALIKRGCEHRDLRLPARSRPLSRNDHFGAPRYAFRPLRPLAPALSAGRAPPTPARALLVGRSPPPPPASAQPGFSLQSCGFRTTVLPPDARAGVASPAIVRTCGYLAAVARTHAIQPAIVRARVTGVAVTRARTIPVAAARTDAIPSAGLGVCAFPVAGPEAPARSRRPGAPRILADRVGCLSLRALTERS